MKESIQTTNITYDYEIVGIDNINNKYKSMVNALNDALKTAKGEVLIFLHQDIVLNSNTNIDLLINNCLRNIALYGVFGVKNNGEEKTSISCITDLWSTYDGLNEGEIQEVFTIDECMFACNKELFNYIKFDGNLCRFWDFYAVDLALQCQKLKIPVYSIGLKITHYSKGNINTKAFKKIERELLKKYKFDFEILTYPCGWNYTNSYKIFRKSLNEKLRILKKKIKFFVYEVLHPRKIFHRLYRFFQKHFQSFLLRFDNQHENKKIVVITHSTSKTGAPLLALNIMKELLKQNYKIVSISLDIDGEGGLYEQFRKSSNYFFSKPSKRIVHLLKQKGYKHYIVNSIASASIMKDIAEPDNKITYLIHELPELIMRLNLVKYVDVVDTYSDTIVFPSTYTKNKYEEAFGKNETLTLIKPQGLYQCENIAIDKTTAKKEICKILNVSPNKKILLCIGTGDKRKGLDLFYELAFAMKNHEEFIFVWIGTFYYKLDSKYENLSNVYHIKYVDDDVLLYKFYRSATFYLMMSRSEPFGSVVLESFNAETPVIAFDDAGGYLDIIENNKTGFLVKYLDMVEYEQTILNKESSKNLNQIIKEAKLLLKNFKFDEYVNYLKGTFK